MDHTMIGKRPQCEKFHKHFSYPMYEVGNQGLWENFGTKFAWIFSTNKSRKKWIS